MYHYDFINRISGFIMDQFQVQHFINKTLGKGLKRYGKNLINKNNPGIYEFVDKGYPVQEGVTNVFV